MTVGRTCALQLRGIHSTLSCYISLWGTVHLKKEEQYGDSAMWVKACHQFLRLDQGLGVECTFVINMEGISVFWRLQQMLCGCSVA